MTHNISTFLEKHKLGQEFADTAQQWFIPHAAQIAAHHDGAKRPLFVGLNGCQGSGKSTLTAFLDEYLTAQHGKHVVCLSLDDFYLDQATRQTLASNIHPLLVTRGVPGTHDTVRMKHCLAALGVGQPTLIPRFDKATDNPLPKSHWTAIEHPVDIIIFEGWCWGVQAQSATSLLTPVNTLEKDEDRNTAWRAYVNTQLREQYAPLYAVMDRWTMLKAPNFDCVFQWRLEQEKKLSQSLDPAHKRSGVMNEQQISRFIQHYQRLTECALSTLPAQCNTVFELDAHRRILCMLEPNT